MDITITYLFRHFEYEREGKMSSYQLKNYKDKPNYELAQLLLEQ